MGYQILYIGPITSEAKHEKLASRFKVNPSIAPIVFQNSLLNGFSKNKVVLDILGLPIIPAFPQSDYLRIPHFNETLGSGYTCSSISSINIPILKQIERKIKIEQHILAWARKYENKKKIIIIYSVYLPAFKAVLRAKKKYAIEATAIVTDLPRHMFTYTQYRRLKKIIRNMYSKYIEQFQDCMDKYVLLTENMHKIVAPDKPFLVIEGIIDGLSNVGDKEEGDIFSIMYAGELNVKYGISNLILAFEKICISHMELWLFGDGDAVPLIKEKQKKDPRIRFFGRVDRQTVIQKEKESSLLINVRNPEDDYTKYSFPSKTMEYMSSGTMLLTTRLKGIPDEYYDYTYTIDNNSVDEIQHGIESVYSMGKENRIKKGFEAQNYIIKNKNSKVQARKILKFLNIKE